MEGLALSHVASVVVALSLLGAHMPAGPPQSALAESTTQPFNAASALPSGDYEHLFRNAAGEVITFDRQRFGLINYGDPTRVTSNDRYVVATLLFRYDQQLPHPDFFCARNQSGCWDIVVHDRMTNALSPLINEINGNFNDDYSTPMPNGFAITDDLTTFVVTMYCHPGASIGGHDCLVPQGEFLLVLHDRDTNQTSVIRSAAAPIGGLQISDDGNTIHIDPGSVLGGALWQRGVGWREVEYPAVNVPTTLSRDGKHLYFGYSTGWDEFDACGYECVSHHIERYSTTDATVSRWSDLPVSPEWISVEKGTVVFSDFESAGSLDPLTGSVGLLREDCLPLGLAADGSLFACANALQIVGQEHPIYLIDVATGEEMTIFSPQEGFSGQSKWRHVTIGSRVVTLFWNHESDPDSYRFWAWKGEFVAGDAEPPTGDPAPPPSGFTDTADSVFKADIEWLAAAGITRGCNPPTNNRFCPNDPVTRGQMAAFLNRALALSPAPNTFTDTAGSVFSADIGALAGAGITRGCNPPTNNRFCPNDPVTRGQMAAFLNRALALSPAPNTFTDTAGSVFSADIGALAGARITRGCNPPVNDRYCPNALVTRGQMAAFLRRSLNT